MASKTTFKAKVLLQKEFTKISFCKELGISRPTLDSRLEGKSKWKKLEHKWISLLYDELIDELSVSYLHDPTTVIKMSRMRQ